jgi:hypothetical protein
VNKLASALILAALSALSAGAGHISVADFEQVLSLIRHDGDAAVAEQIAGFELTERADTARLTRWETSAPGDRSRESLVALADASAFESLPVTDLPTDLPPDASAQQQILSRMMDYVHATRSKLPDFFALRSTTHFEKATLEQMADEEQILQLNTLSKTRIKFRDLGPAASPPFANVRLLYVGTWSEIVTYRSGFEVADIPSGHARQIRHPPFGLTTTGEFGPILAVVAGDARKGKIVWDHWEPSPSRALGVFRYSVSKQNSQFAVEPLAMFGAVQLGPDFPAYHGEIAVDPPTGTIFRISVIGDPGPSDPVSEIGIVVEYGPIIIGGKSYICPVRGVALSRPAEFPTRAQAQSTPSPPPEFLNDVTFTQYQIARGDVRILPGKVPEP